MLPDISSRAARTGATQANVMQRASNEITASRKIFIGRTLSAESLTSRAGQAMSRIANQATKALSQQGRGSQTYTFITSDNICHIKSLPVDAVSPYRNYLSTIPPPPFKDLEWHKGKKHQHRRLSLLLRDLLATSQSRSSTSSCGGAFWRKAEEQFLSEVSTAIQKLRDVRCRSPGFQPSVDDAAEYVLLTIAVMEDLRRIPGSN